MVRVSWNRAAQKNLAAGGNDIGKCGLDLQVRKPPPYGGGDSMKTPSASPRAGGVFSFER